MTNMKAEDLRFLNESKNLVFEEYRNPQDFYDKVLLHAVAMANSSGGCLLFGMNKQKKITGCPYIENLEIVQYLYKNTSPRLLSAANNLAVTCDGSIKNILCIEIYPKKVLVSTATGDIYLREGNESVSFFKDLDPLLDNADNDPSCRIVKNTGEKDIDFTITEKYRQAFRKFNKNLGLLTLQDLSFLKTFGAVTAQDGKTQLTNTGLFLFGKAEAIDKYAPFLGIKYSYIQNKERKEAQFFGGMNILSIIQNVMHKMLDDYPEFRKKENLPDILFQMLLNAFIYQDYERENYISLTNHDGTLEICYMGNCFGKTMPKKYLLPIPVQKNLLLIYAIKKFKIFLFNGTGYAEMLKQLLEEGFECPRFSPMERKTRIIMPLKKTDLKFAAFCKKAKHRAKRDFSFYELVALKLWYKKKSLTAEELTEQTPLKTKTAHKLVEKINRIAKETTTGGFSRVSK